MVGGIVTFIALLALGYLIFVYAGKQTGLNKALGYIIVGIIVVTLIALPVFACARHFSGKSGFSKGQMNCSMNAGPGGFCKPGNAPFMPNSEYCPGFSGNCEIRIDRFDGAIKDFDPGKDIQRFRKFMPKGSFNDGMEFDEKNDMVEDINDTAMWLQKDPKLVDEFIKALKDKPEALKALKDKLK
jgi:hypothetical protein